MMGKAALLALAAAGGGGVAAAATAAAPNVTADPITLDRSGAADTFWGLGGLSGGGATTRLLVDYVEPYRSDILDYLFLPNYGASLQVLKVEIGGDSQSTDGTESSHMHDNTTVNLNTGYEWWLMSEAKKRNPDIKLYGLPWAFPGWVGNDPQTGVPSGSPFTYPNQTSRYLMEWVKGAKSAYDLDIDYVGVWNERASDASYTESLRQTLNDAGFTDTKIVAKDGGSDICTDMAKDPAYAKSIDIIGLHYPSDYQDLTTCHSFGKPVWASEESSSYDDLNGAACWARVVNSHYVLEGITSSIMWNLVGAYYHGTNWYASSMLTSVQPWSGFYEEMEVVWATAHVTQFSQVGWQYLDLEHGSGQLPQGGFYTTLVDPASDNFTLQVVKISRDHASCTRPKLPDFNVTAEKVAFRLAANMPPASGNRLAVWRSNFEAETATLFERQPDITVSAGGSFTLDVQVGDFYTVSTVMTATKGKPKHPVPKSVPQFPLPHTDAFDSYPESQEAMGLADQIGAFEIHPASTANNIHQHHRNGNNNYHSQPLHTNKTNMVLRQMVPQLPIGWSDHGSNGPMTLIGMREWQDITVAADFLLPVAEAAACVGTRVDQMWDYGVVVCVGAGGRWNLTLGGPAQNTSQAKPAILSGAGPAVATGEWHRLSLTTVGGSASASVDGTALFANATVRDVDTGFAALGMNTWYAVEFDNLEIDQAGGDSRWGQAAAALPKGCQAAAVGQSLSVRPCVANGLSAPDQQFELLPDWGLRHMPSGLCVQYASDTAAPTLQACSYDDPKQQFRNDYTRIRNTEVPLELTTLGMPGGTRCLAGAYAGGAVTTPPESSDGAVNDATFNQWSYFPNTFQLRNQYTAGQAGSGYPLCLSACTAPAAEATA